VRDARLVQLAGQQFNRVSRAQLAELGFDDNAIHHRVTHHRLVAVEQAVFAVAPLLDDDWGRWKGATLTAPGSMLSHFSAAAAREFWYRRRSLETITRPGTGGPRRHGGVLVYRSSTLQGNTEELCGIPITTVREAIRLKLTTVVELFEYCERHLRTRGTGRLRAVLTRYSAIPLNRARSGAEVRAMEVLRDGVFLLPNLNHLIAGEEADLSWPQQRLIIEIDGGPFHLDRGEDARKQAIWESAGWTVRRIPSDDIYEAPERLVALAASSNVPRHMA
jgi:very-short-patch-repair endonuclease